MNEVYVDESWDFYLSVLQDGNPVTVYFMKMHTTRDRVEGMCKYACDQLGIEADVEVTERYMGMFTARITPKEASNED